MCIRHVSCSTLLYACETWTIYRENMKVLERFHQKCIRRILNINWEMRVSDVEILERSKCTSIESLIYKSKLRWVGHILRMEDERIPKKLLYGELTTGKRPAHKPKKRYKDDIKHTLKQCNISLDNWENIALDRLAWRKLIYRGVENFEKSRQEHEKLKRSLRKFEKPQLPTSLKTFNCNICFRICLSLAGYKSHMRKHNNIDQISANQEAPPIINNNLVLSCSLCEKICKSAGGLKRHMKIHNTNDSNTNINDSSNTNRVHCLICIREFKSLAGLRSHERAFHK